MPSPTKSGYVGASYPNAVVDEGAKIPPEFAPCGAGKGARIMDNREEISCFTEFEENTAFSRAYLCKSAKKRTK